MVTTRKHWLVLVTAPNPRVARRLARAALEPRLAACANLVSGLESHYWWQGRLERSREVLLLFKTTRRNLGALETAIRGAHPYDTPEIIALPVSLGAQKYLEWIDASVHPGAPAGP